MRQSYIAAALPLAVLVACGEYESPAGATVRDSAGVAIVENAALHAPDSAWHVSPEPVLTIGVVDGEEPYQFQYIRGVTRLSDGRIAVADNGSSQIRFFDQGGRHLFSVGREGDGPGEFRFIDHLIARPGDSLIVVSGNTGTAYSIIPPTAHEASPVAFVMGFYNPDAMVADGRTVHVRYANSIARDAVGVVQDSILIVVADLPAALARGGAREVADGGTIAPVQLDPAGIPADTVVRIPGNAEFRRAVGNGISNTGVAFGRRVETAVQDDRILIGVGTEGVVQVHGLDGRLVRSIRFTGGREPLTTAEIDAWQQWRQALARNEVQRQGAEAYIEAMQFPAERPVSGRIVVDRDGWIWIERYMPDSGYAPRMTEAPRRWYVLDPDGRAATAVDVPADFRIEEIGSDYLLGIATDADGVETVRMYSLRPGPGELVFHR